MTVIEVEVSTPQFKGNKLDYFLTQKGTLETESWKFYGTNHNISFHDEETFARYVTELPKSPDIFKVSTHKAALKNVTERHAEWVKQNNQPY